MAAAAVQEEGRRISGYERRGTIGHSKRIRPPAANVVYSYSPLSRFPKSLPMIPGRASYFCGISNETISMPPPLFAPEQRERESSLLNAIIHCMYFCFYSHNDRDEGKTGGKEGKHCRIVSGMISAAKAAARPQHFQSLSVSLMSMGLASWHIPRQNEKLQGVT